MSSPFISAAVLKSVGITQTPPKLQNYFWKLSDPASASGGAGSNAPNSRNLQGSYVTETPDLYALAQQISQQTGLPASRVELFSCPLIYTGEDFAANPHRYVSPKLFDYYQSTPWRFGAKWFQATPQAFYVVEDRNFNQNADDWVGDGFHEGDKPKSLIAGIGHFGRGTYNDLLFAGLIVECAYSTQEISGISENPLDSPPPLLEAFIIGVGVLIATICSCGVGAAVAGGSAAIAAGASAGAIVGGASAGGSFTAVAATGSAVAAVIPAAAAAGGSLATTLGTIGTVTGLVTTGATLVVKALNMAGVDTGSAGDTIAAVGSAAQGAASTIGASNMTDAVSKGAGTLSGIIQKVAPNAPVATAAASVNTYVQGTTSAIQNGTSPLQAAVDTSKQVVTQVAQQGGILPSHTSVPGASTPESMGDYASSVVLTVPPVGPNKDPDVDTAGGTTAFVAMINKYITDEKERKSGRYYVPMVPPDALAAYVQRRRLGASVSESLSVARNIAPYHWRWATLTQSTFMPTAALLDRLNKLVALHQANEQIAASSNVDPSVMLLAGCAVPGYHPPNNFHKIFSPGIFSMLARRSGLVGSSDSGSFATGAVALAAGVGLIYLLAKRKKARR